MIINKINDLNPIVLICGTTALVTVVLGATIVLTKSGNFSYENGDTVIRVESAIAKEKANNEAYSSKRLSEELNKLKLAIEANKGTTAPEIKEAFEGLEPTANTAIKNSEELREVVEGSIEKPDTIVD